VSSHVGKTAFEAGTAVPGPAGVRDAAPGDAGPVRIHDRPRRTHRRSATRPARLPGLLVVAVPAGAELAIGGYQIGSPPLWYDEGATIDAARRPAGGIIAMLGHQDVVNGLYYLLEHVVVLALGTGPVELRLPSLLAAAAAAGMTAALGSQLARLAGGRSPRLTGLLAGLLLTAIPITTFYAQDARAYELVVLCAVTATYLLLRAVRSNARRWWAGYATAIVLLGLFNLFALTLIVAHGVSIASARRWPGGRPAAADPEPGRPVPVRWAQATAAALACLSPLAVAASRQASLISWVTRPGAGDVLDLVREFAGSGILIPVVAALVAAALLADPVRTSGGLSPAVVALPWLVLPATLLLSVSVLHPVYVDRYVLFSLPALALLVAAGLVTLPAVAARLTADGPAVIRRVLPLAAPVAVLALIGSAVTWPQLAVRQAGRTPDEFQDVAAVVARGVRPGDAVLYLPWDAQVIGLTYPAAFARLADIGQLRSPLASATLYGTPVSTAMLRRRLLAASRLWTIQLTDDTLHAAFEPSAAWDRQEQALIHSRRLLRAWVIGAVTVRLYHAPGPSPLGTPPPARGLRPLLARPNAKPPGSGGSRAAR
jgi:mannosyltransferase